MPSCDRILRLMLMFASWHPATDVTDTHKWHQVTINWAGKLGIYSPKKMAIGGKPMINRVGRSRRFLVKLMSVLWVYSRPVQYVTWSRHLQLADELIVPAGIKLERNIWWRIWATRIRQFLGEVNKYKTRVKDIFKDDQSRSIWNQLPAVMVPCCS